MLVVQHFLRSVDAHRGVELLTVPSAFFARTFTVLPGAKFSSTSVSPTMSYTSSPVRPLVSAFSSSRNCSGRIPMPTRFERWMRSKLSASTARTPSNRGPLAAQSRDEPEPYSLPASTISGVPAARYFTDASKMNISSPSGRWRV